MRRRDLLTAVLGVASLAGCTGNETTGNTTSTPPETPVPYEFPEDVSEDGITNIIGLLDTTAEQTVSKSASMEAVRDSEHEVDFEKIIEVDSGTLYLKQEDQDGDSLEGYVRKEEEGVTAFVRKVVDGELTYEDEGQSLEAQEEDPIQSVAFHQISENLSEVKSFEYEYSEGVMYQDRVAGLYESTGLSQIGEERYEAGESDVIVDESGWMLAHSYEAESAHGHGTTSFNTEFGGIGQTAVTEPDWLDEAREETQN